jgi:glycosyltransferase involved in cell wall biosynthesis
MLRNVSVTPLVSVIIPTYNRAHVVPEAIESVLLQTYPHIEVIVVDDGSTDNTPECLQQFASRVRVITQANAGPAAARNRGIEVAKGELIAFLDSDDLWLPTKLERQVTLLEQAGMSVPCCVCNIRMQWSELEACSFDIAALDPHLEEGIWANAGEVLSTRFLLFTQGVVIRREVLGRIGGFDESLWLLEDHELALRLSLESPWGFIRDPLVIWRESKTGSLYQSAARDEIRQVEPLVEILDRHLSRLQKSSVRNTIRKSVRRELDRNKRQLRAVKMCAGNSVVTSSTGRLLRYIERCRRAIFIRSPWFPTMKIASCSMI